MIVARPRFWLPLLPGFLALSACTVAPKPAVSGARVTESFDAGWRFLKADAPGAEAADSSDTAWRVLDLPHDWSIEGPFEQNAPARGAGGFLPSGVAWYRKHFTLPAGDATRRVFIEFDGAMANSDVWINGQLLGHRPYGYASFRYELTGKLYFGPDTTNVLAVRTDTSQQPASRWYAGAGIYRHVRLVVTDPVHLDYHGTFVTTPSISSESASVHVTGLITNQSSAAREVSLQVTLVAPDGQTVASTQTPPQGVAGGQSLEFSSDLTIGSPRLWNLDSPVLYRALVRVRAGDITLDDEAIPFGIRDARFEAATGFWLNGKNLKLRGVCVHQDGSAFGAAVPLAVWERRLTALRQLGVNAIRTAHNPPDPGFLDLCDRMGFLVMDELFDCWTVAKNPYDYHLYFADWSKIDARDTVRRDRNHPSVVLWSAGNEIHDTPKAELAKQILASLVAVFHDNDPTRPVTQALFRPNASHDYTDGLADLLDVIGTNYRDGELIAAWRAKPSRKIIGTEQRQDRETWLELRDHPAEAGQFLWTGVDYLGEAFRWPTVASGSGLVDKTGTIKPNSRERESWWSARPMVAMVRRTAPAQTSPTDPGFVPLNRRQVVFADWTPANAQPHSENVEVYSNCDVVELSLNGQSLGTQPLNADASPRRWKVPYAPGTLKAVAKNKDQIVATDELRTAGAPARILLSTDRAKLAPTFDEVAFVTALVVDADGVVVPAAANLVTFSLSGPGVIAAVDSANNASHEPYQASERYAFQGRCLALVKATAAAGRIVVTASAAGLAADALVVEASPRR